MNLNISDMKRTYLLFTILTIFILTLSSCHKDEKMESRYLSYATIIDDVNKVLVTDIDAAALYVEQNGEIVQWTIGKRMIVDYTILSHKVSASVAKAYYVRINHVYDILTKNPVDQSFLNTSAREDSIGNDPINLHNIWFSNSYLNLDFGIYRNNHGITHFINLVVDDSKTTTDDVYAELRHNAYFDLQTFYAKGNVSFNVSKFLVSPKKYVKIHLKRKTYSGEVKIDTLTYQPGLLSVAPFAATLRSDIK